MEPDQVTEPQVETEDVEVSFDQAINEEKNGTDPVAENKQPEPEEDVVEILEPKAKVVNWTIGKGDLSRTYTQRPLSFIAKMQWFSLVGGVLDKAMSGEDALTVSNLMSAPQGRGGSLSVDDFRDADTFIQAVGKLLVEAPTFLVDSYCIWLQVPDYDRDLVKQIMALPEDQGGLSDDQGIEIIETFIDQNFEALDSFFRQKIAKVQKRLSQRADQARESRPSKP